jgi:ligand-binding sensor domain-containing protein
LRIGSDGTPVETIQTLPIEYRDGYKTLNVVNQGKFHAFITQAESIFQFDQLSGRWELLAKAAGNLPGNGVESLATDGGRIWAQTTFGKSSSYYGMSWKWLDAERGAWRFFGAYSVFEDQIDSYNSRANILWVGRRLASRRHVGLILGGSEWELPEGITAILDLGSGTVWGATNGAMQKCLWISRTCVATTVPAIAQIAPVNSIVDDRNGGLWLGGTGGLVRYDVASGTGAFIAINPGGLPAQASGATDRLAVSSMIITSEKIIQIGTNRGLFQLDTSNSQFSVTSNPAVTERINEIAEDAAGNLWLRFASGVGRLDSFGDLRSFTIKAPPSPEVRDKTEFTRVATGTPTLPDGQGGIWVGTPRGLLRQGWNEKGVPGRAVEFPFMSDMKNFARVTKIADGRLAVWETRPTGVVLRTPDAATPIALPVSYPITALENGPNGGVWTGYALGGISFQSPNSLRRHFSTADGLPDSSVLSISPVPNDPGRVWVATNDGAAVVSLEDHDRPVRSMRMSAPGSEPMLVPGPVDAVRALPDGGAWLAFNALSSDLFWRAGDVDSRPPSFLVRVSADGKEMGPRLLIPRGDVLALAMNPHDTNVLWVGTTSGLYRFRTGEAGLVPITARGTLRAAPVRELGVDPDTGVVWMGVDAEGPDVSASLVGYDPSDDTIKNFTPDHDGLPFAQRIDSIDFSPMGNLVVLAAGQLVGGQLIVPKSRLGLWLTATLFGGLLLGLVAVLSITWLKAYRLKIARYRPMLEAARSFFTLLGLRTRVLDFRTLLVPERRLALAGPVEAIDSSPALDSRNVPVRCAANELLPVEEVQATFKAGDAKGGSDRIYSYLVYPRELDPAAARQLDVYRLRENAIIIPLSLRFLLAKIAEGADAARSALDGLRRRYLGEHDLFDMRNVLDEPRFFFGRRALIDELSRALSRGEHAALIGLRKSGKSSLLNLLQQRMDQFPVAKVDMQLYSRTQDPTWPGKLFIRIIEAYDNWGRARHGSGWNIPAITGPVDASELETALRNRRDRQRALGSDLPLIVLIDEIERVFPKEGGVSEEEVQQFVHDVQRFVHAAGALRALGQEGGDKLLSLVVADRLPAFNRTNTFSGARADTNPFYRFFKEFYLEPLQFEECSEMLREIGQAMGLELDDEVVQQIYEDSGGYVSLARQLASAACRHRKGSSRLDTSHYMAGLGWIKEQSGEADIFFRENFWDQSTSAERRLLYLASREGGARGEELENPGPIPVLEDTQLFHPDQIVSRSQLVDGRRMLLATGMLLRRRVLKLTLPAHDREPVPLIDPHPQAGLASGSGVASG